MPGKRIYQYEAMFLFGQSTAADLAGCVAHLNEIFARAQAEVVAMRKWDDRRLAYEIAGQKRGTYILVYFKAPNESMLGFDRDCNLSEKILRHLLIRADYMTIEQMQAADARRELELEAKMRAEKPATAEAAAEPVAAAVSDDGEPA
ncbi:MAG: 30S ribosomal protein S6 [Phycisphaeraceae bacterium]|nr:30S ribosomal protein S6 [Phycisphaeraceae bacterium]